MRLSAVVDKASLHVVPLLPWGATPLRRPSPGVMIPLPPASSQLVAMAVADLAVTALPAPPLSDAAAVRRVRGWFVVLAVLALATFVLGVRNRLTAGGLFLFPPEIDWLPPLSAARWWDAYQLHQQDPAFAACGASESLEDFQVLYGREWLRQACGLLLAATAAVGLLGAAVMPRFRFALPRLIGLGLIGLAYAGATALVAFAIAHAEPLSRFNTGQYRHAVDLVFASAALALVLASAVRPPTPPGLRRQDPGAATWLWGGAVLLAIATGALFAARDATGVWTTWPGYEGGILPPADRLLSFSPPWLNLTANQYTIQLSHRMIAAGLWLAASAWLVAALVRRGPLRNALALFLLISAEIAIGVVTLAAGAPPLPSILHQVGGVVVLAGALALRRREAASVRAVIGAPIIGYEHF